MVLVALPVVAPEPRGQKVSQARLGRPPEARADRSSQRARHLVHLGELSAARQAKRLAAPSSSPSRPGQVLRALFTSLPAALELNPEATIVSVDGMGGFDTTSRQSMLQGLLGVPGANECLPFVRMFYSEPSEYVLNDSGGVPHIVQQAGGGSLNASFARAWPAPSTAGSAQPFA